MRFNEEFENVIDNIEELKEIIPYKYEKLNKKNLIMMRVASMSGSIFRMVLASAFYIIVTLAAIKILFFM